MLHQQETFDDPHMNGLLPALVPSRRGFITASASVGFALAAGPLNAQSAIRTPADGLDVADLTVPVPGGQMPAYRAAPAKAGKYPVVIVVPEIFGMHEYQKTFAAAWPNWAMSASRRTRFSASAILPR